MTKPEPSQSKLSRPGDAEQEINVITELPQAEHERRTDDLANLWLHGGLGKSKDMDLTPELLLLMVRAGKLLTRAQHDRAMDYIVSHYQYFPNPAQYHAAGLNVPVGSLANAGAEDVATEEAHLWEWVREWAERLAEGCRVTVSLEDGSTHTGVTWCVREWLYDYTFPGNAATRHFCHVRIELPPKIPYLLELIFQQIEPTIGKALHRFLDYTTIGDDYLRGQFKKAALAMIARRAERASRAPTLLLTSGLPDDSLLKRSELWSADRLRVFQGILSLSQPTTYHSHAVAYHSVETLQGALDKEGNPVYTDEDIENQKLLIANGEEIFGYVPYLVSEKIRLEGAQRKAEEQAADLARKESLQRRKETESEREYRRELVIRDMQNERGRELRRLRDAAYGLDRRESDESYEKYFRDLRDG